jgi:hypothetical protein
VVELRNDRVADADPFGEAVADGIAAFLAAHG